MTKAEEMAMKTVHDLGVAGAWDVCNYTGLSPAEAGLALGSLCRKGYLKVVSMECERDANEHGEAINVEVYTLWEFTPEGKKAAKKIPDIDEPMCIPITNIQLEKYENRCIWDYCSNGRTTEAAEPQPDGIQFRTVDDLGRICIPKDIRDKLGIKPGTECAVYATDELTNEEIIVIRRNKNDKH